MTRTDRSIVLLLSLSLALVATVIAWPSLAPAVVPTAAGASPTPAASVLDAGTYREGIVGRPTDASPFGARTQADRDLVALVFAGLVRIGPDESVEPDLASDWTVDPTGTTYVFHLRPDATWQDGEPVTADDVLFTIHALQDPDYSGPAGSSWSEVNVTAEDSHTVTFELKRPLGGFLTAFAQPIAPAHLLEGVAASDLATDPFGLQPVGSGPFRLVSSNADLAVLERRTDMPSASASTTMGDGATPRASSTPSIALTPRPSPAASNEAGEPIRRIELHFYSSPDDLAAAFRAGGLDAADGLPATQATDLASLSGVHLVPNRLTTVSAILVNVRSDHKEFRDVRTRQALLAAIDRDRIVATVLGGLGSRADSLIPPTSPMFAASQSQIVAYDPTAAAKALAAAGWKKVGGRWRAPGAKAPFKLELITPDAESNPTSTLLADAIAGDWRALGFDVVVAPLPPAVYVDDRLRTGDFVTAIVDLAIGHDPDLYPLLASTQVVSGGSNLSGLQDPVLDKKLVAAREAVAPDARRAAYAELQAYLAANRFVLPIAVRDDPLVVTSRVLGPSPRTIADRSERFIDVLTWRLAGGR